MIARPKIKHLAIIAIDSERLAKFYEDIFGMTRLQRPANKPKKSKVVFMTDGYLTHGIWASSSVDLAYKYL
jgi:predicted enzyme related to lactoylglutathione lyase